MLYVKKPIVVEAFQMTVERREDSTDWPEWLHNAWQKDFEEEGAFFPLSTSRWIHTLEGNLNVSVGDWIIREVKGELYPCKPDIFEATYEEFSQ